MKLTKLIAATSYHGVTRQPIADEVLAKGTLIKDVLKLDGYTSFLASSDGRSWFLYRSCGKLSVTE